LCSLAAEPGQFGALRLRVSLIEKSAERDHGKGWQKPPHTRIPRDCYPARWYAQIAHAYTGFDLPLRPRICRERLQLPGRQIYGFTPAIPFIAHSANTNSNRFPSVASPSSPLVWKFPL
jgi:hypothetical protein